jgi:hypothetical protein
VDLPASHMSWRKSGELSDVSQSAVDPSGLMLEPPATEMHLGPKSQGMASQSAAFISVGTFVGKAVGPRVGDAVGTAVGLLVGDAVGTGVGTGVGAAVGP